MKIYRVSQLIEFIDIFKNNSYFFYFLPISFDIINIVIIIRLFQDTYKSALKAEKDAVASFESEHEVRVGKRKIKYNKFENYVEYPGPPKLALSHKEPDKSNIAG